MRPDAVLFAGKVKFFCSKKFIRRLAYDRLSGGAQKRTFQRPIGLGRDVKRPYLQMNAPPPVGVHVRARLSAQAFGALIGVSG